MQRNWWSALAAAGLLAWVAPLSAATVELEAPAALELQVAGFELLQGAELSIDAQGLRAESYGGGEQWLHKLGRAWFGSDDDRSQRGCYAWILDAATREAVWTLDLEEADRGEQRDQRRDQTRIKLPAGRYQVFLFGGNAELRYSRDDEDVSDSRKREFEAIERDLQDCYVRVEADGLREMEPSGQFDDALVAMVGLGDSEFRRQAFELTRDAELRIYGMMEQSPGDDDPSDFGWIVSLDDGRRVFDMSDRRGRSAGGASKNRLLQRTVRLKPGRYMLVYGTDDSHSAHEFNAAPPVDALAWGIQLLPSEEFDPSTFHLIDSPQRRAAAIDFSGARDDAFFEQGFHLDRDTGVYIYALGESTDRGWTWADHGWIIDASTRETVWGMDGRNTTPAGGASKNRMFDGMVNLPAGDYIAYYLTDGSHSFQEWNSAAPFEPEAWGMQIAADSRRDLELADTAELTSGAGVLADLTRARDDQTLRKRFTVDAPTEVEIYAVGEGTGDDMADLGYIRSLEDDRTVWEMKYRDTDPAGGATKNRAVHTRLRLEPGEYEAVFETDGSHAFGEWNADPPADPLSWGMTIRVVR